MPLKKQPDESWERECEACATTEGVLCDGCDCCQECCNCSVTDCDCDACTNRRQEEPHAYGECGSRFGECPACAADRESGNFDG